MTEEETKMRASDFESKAYGKRESFEFNTSGRTIMDVLLMIQREYKLRSYTLNAVSAKYLGEQKEDVHHSLITGMWNGSDSDRTRLASYCLKDTYLPQRLLDKLMLLTNSIEMIRVCGIPLKMLLTKGQQVKVTAQLYARTRKDGYLVPYVKPPDVVTTKYEGAIVLDPVKVFWIKT